MRKIYAENMSRKYLFYWKELMVLKITIFLFLLGAEEESTWYFNNSKLKTSSTVTFFLSFIWMLEKVRTRFIFSRSFCGPLRMHFVCTVQVFEVGKRARVCSLYLCTVCMTMVYREICIRLCRLLDYLLVSLFLHIRKIANLVRIIIYGTQILSHALTHNAAIQFC